MLCRMGRCNRRAPDLYSPASLEIMAFSGVSRTPLDILSNSLPVTIHPRATTAPNAAGEEGGGTRRLRQDSKQAMHAVGAAGGRGQHGGATHEHPEPRERR